MYRIRHKKLDTIVEYSLDVMVDGKYMSMAMGDLTFVTQIAIESYGLDQDDLTFAFEQMAKNKHTVAEFGIRGFFLFSRAA